MRSCPGVDADEVLLQTLNWATCVQFLRLGFAGYTKIMKNMHTVSLYLAKAIAAIGATPCIPSPCSPGRHVSRVRLHEMMHGCVWTHQLVKWLRSERT